MIEKFRSLVHADEAEEIEEYDENDTSSTANQEEEKEDKESEPAEAADVAKPELAEKRRRRLRLARLKRRSIAARAYQFSGAKDGVSGIVFLEVSKVFDLPPERNGENFAFYIISPANTSSNAYFIRHGPIHCYFSRTQDNAYSRYPT